MGNKSIVAHKIGQVEIRANRLLSIYLFTVLLGLILVIIGIAVDYFVNFPNDTTVISIIVVGLAIVFTASWFPKFQRFIDQNVLGIRASSLEIVETFTNQIITSLTYDSIVKIIQNELLPSLSIRQSALFPVEKGFVMEPIVQIGIKENPLPNSAHIPEMAKDFRKLRQLDENKYLPWVRLIIPLIIDQELCGIWLFGRRDPDDHYATTEITALQTIANHTAITLENIRQREHIRALYQDNIQRYEREQKKLAHDLHDEILNGLAVLGMMVDDDQSSSEFQKEYDKLATHIRRIISGLQPAMLEYGLYLAIEELCHELSDRINGDILIEFAIDPSDKRYESSLEGHIYRIVQQACENAVQHAQANRVTVRGKLQTDQIYLSVEDDGKGFSPEEYLQTTDNKQRNHYGLTVIQERAELIGADLKITSSQGNGTRIEIQLDDLLHKQAQFLARIKAEKALFDSEAKATTLMNAFSDVIMLIDTNDIIIDANQAMARRVNRDLDDIIGKQVWDFISQEVAERRKVYHAKAIRTGKTIRYEDERAGKWHDNTLTPVRDADGMITRLAIFSRDITAKKNAEHALTTSERNFRALAENANDGILIADEQGNHVYANHKAAEITGYSISELLETHISDLAHPEELKKITTRFRGRFEGNTSMSQYETIILGKSGDEITIGLTAAQTIWNNKPSVMVIIRDITETNTND